MKIEKQKIYILDSKKSITESEVFKSFLEEKGMMPIITTYGLNGIRIKWNEGD